MKIFQLTIEQKSTLFLDKQKCVAELEQVILSSIENLSEKEKLEIKRSIEKIVLGEKSNHKLNTTEIISHNLDENQIVSLKIIEHNFLSTKISITELEVIE